MADAATGNQRLRTRKDLLLAAARLMKRGRAPSMEEVAEEALVSRATIYRYFSKIEELLIEVPIDEAVPGPQGLFAGEEKLDIEERVDRAEARLHELTYKNEAQLRLMLAHSLQGHNRTSEVPVRQNRRTDYIEEALAPFQKDFDSESYKKLCAALALIFGTEAMIVFRDVLPLEPHKARKVKSWAVKALVRAALEEARRVAKKK